MKQQPPAMSLMELARMAEERAVEMFTEGDPEGAFDGARAARRVASRVKARMLLLGGSVSVRGGACVCEDPDAWWGFSGEAPDACPACGRRLGG